MPRSSQTPLRPQRSLKQTSSARLQGNMPSFAPGRAQHIMHVSSGKRSKACKTACTTGTHLHVSRETSL